MSNIIERLLKKSAIPDKESALAGRSNPIKISGLHAVNKVPLDSPLQKNESAIILGLGCFWGAERKFWNTSGVTVTSVGYAGGYTPNPTYEEVCTGKTGHAEVIKVVFNTSSTSLEEVLKVFWECHDPTQGMRQGNDIGSQYRSVIYTLDNADITIAEASKTAFQKALISSGHPMITTEIKSLDVYYFAEEYHQQYLHKNPNGYCGLAGTGVTCPLP